MRSMIPVGAESWTYRGCSGLMAADISSGRSRLRDRSPVGTTRYHRGFRSNPTSTSPRVASSCRLMEFWRGAKPCTHGVPNLAAHITESSHFAGPAVVANEPYLRTRGMPHTGAGDPFLGWVRPTANGVRPVGCTHAAITRLLPCDVQVKQNLARC